MSDKCNTKDRKITFSLNLVNDSDVIEFVDSIPVPLRGHMIKDAIRNYMEKYKILIKQDSNTNKRDNFKDKVNSKDDSPDIKDGSNAFKNIF